MDVPLIAQDTSIICPTLWVGHCHHSQGSEYPDTRFFCNADSSACNSELIMSPYQCFLFKMSTCLGRIVTPPPPSFPNLLPIKQKKFFFFFRHLQDSWREADLTTFCASLTEADFSTTRWLKACERSPLNHSITLTNPHHRAHPVQLHTTHTSCFPQAVTGRGRESPSEWLLFSLLGWLLPEGRVLMSSPDPR